MKAIRSDDEKWEKSKGTQVKPKLSLPSIYTSDNSLQMAR